MKIGLRLGERDRQILEALARLEPCLATVIAADVDLPTNEVRARLHRMRRNGFVELERPSHRLWWRLAPSRARGSRGRANGPDVAGSASRSGLTRSVEDDADRVKRSARPRKLFR